MQIKKFGDTVAAKARAKELYMTPHTERDGRRYTFAEISAILADELNYSVRPNSVGLWAKKRDANGVSWETEYRAREISGIQEATREVAADIRTVAKQRYVEAEALFSKANRILDTVLSSMSGTIERLARAYTPFGPPNVENVPFEVLYDQIPDITRFPGMVSGEMFKRLKLLEAQRDAINGDDYNKKSSQELLAEIAEIEAQCGD